VTSPPRPSRRSDCSGVTLIELMIVLVIIAVGILTLSGVQTRSSTDVYSTGRRTRAIALAQNQMEVARGLGYTLATPDSGQADGFDWRTAVDSVDVGLNRVTVTVSWTEKETPRSVQFLNLLSTR
jgi:prepilin-type N-terminal cleavage/methylation domain-containing protein